jgi:hypothetical protein
MSERTGQDAVTELRARGYAVLPAPRQVALRSGTVRLDAGWRLETAGIPCDDIAIHALIEQLHREHDLALAGAGADAATVLLSVRAGAVDTGTGDERDPQAYRLTLAPDRIEAVGNAPQGLFYGVQTLLQLLDGNGREKRVLPQAVIADWPEYQLRFVHWDTKHHQDRLETLKRFLDWMARLKLNMVAFELEDKFEYPSHPVIGAPGAFTTAEMQELTRYALARYIQIVPDVQAPAHLCYVLKHPEFAPLRCDGSNYQICMDDPQARRLLFDMYDDVCRATEGVGYVLVSTDEVYYAGICEKYRKPYNPENRSLTWVDYVQAAHEHLAKKGRRIIIWAEFPLLAEHVGLLPPDIIDGVLSPDKGAAMVRAEDERGLRQLVYASMQGGEMLFPNHLAYVDKSGKQHAGRLADALQTTLRPNATGGKPIGTFAAAWDDCGLHNETFWLGWAAMAQGSWTPDTASVEETSQAFFDIYYGRNAVGMAEVYRAMQDQARFWESAWERVPSKVRGPGYGSSGGKRPVRRTDLSLQPPALPRLPDLAFTPFFKVRYARLVGEAPARLQENDRLLARLEENLGRADRNRYNLEVLRSLARSMRQFIETLPALAAAEDLLAAAHAAEKAADRPQAAGLMVGAHAKVSEVIESNRTVYQELVHVWEKSRISRNAPVGGKSFLHVMDDVKDHFADRRADLSYHTAPFESIGLDLWRDALAEIIRGYARIHGIPVEVKR